jgi:hypothetical protein
MENKYYTPSIEEFYVGFEYDTFIAPNEHREGNGWISVKFPDPFTGSNLGPIKRRLSEDNIRVKYLDKEDIENLGFINIDHEYFRLGDYLIQNFFDRKELRIFKAENEQYFDEYTHYSLFHGTIKNKSELIKLLKQLEVC